MGVMLRAYITAEKGTPMHRCPRCSHPNDPRFQQSDSVATHRWYVCATCRHTYRTLANDGGNLPTQHTTNQFSHVELLVAESPHNAKGSTPARVPVKPGGRPRRYPLPPFPCPSCGEPGRTVATLQGYWGGRWRRHKCRGCWEVFYSCTTGKPGSEHVVEITRQHPRHTERAQRRPEKAMDADELVQTMRELRTPSPDDPNYELGTTLRSILHEARELPAEVDGMVACPSCGAIEGTPEWGTVGDGYDGYCPACADSRLRYG